MLSIAVAVACFALLLATPDARGQSPTCDEFNPDVNGPVYAMAVQADGKILVGGNFMMISGQVRSCIGRLNPDGTLDDGFDLGANYPVSSLVVQADGKILVGGEFTTLGGQARNYLGRLNADGTLDAGFNPGATGHVSSLAEQADGKILVGGGFTTLGGQPRSRIARLNPDGTLDAEFNPGANGFVYSLAVQADGKILVGGGYTMLGGQACSHIGRLNPDGTLDTGTDPGANSYVFALAVQTDGKILVSGDFTALDGRTRNHIGRLNPDCTLDTGFNPGTDWIVYSLALQADGRILVGGYFYTLSGQPRNGIGRLNPDGTLDTGFNPGANSYVTSLAMQADGKILVAGGFTTLGGQTRKGIGRLDAATPATQSLTYDDSTLIWLRGDASPEVWRTVFDWSSDGQLWTPLGEGLRVHGGWQRTNAFVPAQATIRARGFVTGGRRSSSSWFVEDYWGPLVWITRPVSRTNDAGTTATFGGVLGGIPPIDYQWFKNGLAVTNGARIAGAKTPWLKLSQVLGADAGGYHLVASNAYGIKTSVAATLTVNDPVLALSPVSQNRQLGENATLSVTVIGTAPLSYQWWKDGVAMTGRTESAISLTNLEVADAGAYWVVGRNSYGSTTSSVARLAVNGATLDADFNPGANGWVNSLAVQADGKILVGGQFSTLGGQPRDRIGRLNPDGTLDEEFNPGANWGVFSLVVQSDEKILVGGEFARLGGQPRTGIGRLHPDGALDSGFNPEANGRVSSLSVQSDGKILVGGYFTTLCGQQCDYIGRLNPSGTLDPGFSPGASAPVSSLVVQADGKILVGGDFTTLGGQTRNYIGRLNPDGTLDTEFNPGAGGPVSSLVVQADGKILVGGTFTALNGQKCEYIGRLNPDGTLDAGFNPGANRAVYCIALQTDGRILVGGWFTELGGQPRYNIGRLNPDGTLDAGFYPGAGSYVFALAVQADGKTLAGGDFATLGGRGRYSIGRLNASAPATQSLTYEGSTITWLRGGTSPEVWRTSFDWSNDGQVWIPLGEGTRLPGGWQRTTATLPAQSTLRARGFVSGTDPGWFVEAHWGVPVWIAQPVNRTNDAGSTATLSGLADGTPPLSYQWFKGGTSLGDGAHFTGVTTPQLTITNVLGADAGGYCLVASNAYGTRTSLVATLTVNDPAITLPPSSQNRELGEDVTLRVMARGTAPLRYQWWKDGLAMIGQTNPSIALTNLVESDAGGYSAVVSSPYGSATSSVALLTVNGASADTRFKPEASGSVYSLAVQEDGKILVGGNFIMLDGQPRSRIARLNADGTLDSGFNPGANSQLSSLAVQEDGKILVGGRFVTLGGQQRGYIARLNADGTLDTGFNPGANSYVDCMAVQTDGKILLGGDFTTLVGQARGHIARLNADGTLDTGFNPGASSSVRSLAVQADGKILVGGDFTTLGGQTCGHIGRLNPDGTLDTGFDPGADSGVYSLAIQADGRILACGYFTSLGGQPRSRIARLNADGTLDTGFNPGADSSVYSFAMQTDGKILVGGDFTLLGGQPRSRIARLNADGTLDTGFNPGAGSSVYSLAIQADGRVLVGGYFTSLGGQSCNYIGRLNVGDAATQNLRYEGSTITWLRGGTSPEVWRTVFDWSSDGLVWTPLGQGTRVSGGWQVTNIAVATQSTLRARGFVVGGNQNSSSWFVEGFWGAPGWITQPISRTNDAGSTATFDGLAGGPSPLNYQWFKGGIPLMDDGHIMGVTTPKLTLTNVLGADAGGYYLVVSNAHGTRTGMVATLTVNDPLITVSPASQNRHAGDSATLSVVALGTTPLTYQWWKDAAALIGQTESSLTLTNLGVPDAGSYWAVVGGPYGSATSSVALLAVNGATLDLGFNPGENGSVYSLAVQGNGKILVGGDFTTLGGQTRNYIARLNADGTLDTEFNPGAGASVRSLAVQADSKVLAGGYFYWLGGQTRTSIGRLNPDGTLDIGFNPGGNGSVYSLALQADGKILVGGWFTTLGGQPRDRIGRLNSDGTLDDSFNPGVDWFVYSLAVQADGRILVGGDFTRLGGQPRNRIGRLNPDGTLDTEFNPGADGKVYSLAVQADGKILVGGDFTTLGGQPRNRIGRLNPDGTLDTGFNPGASGSIHSLAVQADEKILVGGDFTMLAGQTRNYIGRLNADGTLDISFDPGADRGVLSLGLLADGKILVGGLFSSLAGQPRKCVGRLNATDLATQSLTYDGSTITWLRGGTSPEVWHTAFDWSTDGRTWTRAGEVIRLPGGWQLTNAIIPAQATIRARGFVAGGYHNASGWFEEQYLGAPHWIAQPVNRTNDAGSTATFSGLADRPAPASYQWFKDGMAIIDGPRITGANTSRLTLSEVLGADAGGYFLVAGSAYGPRTSVVATLTVNDPIITVSPVGQSLHAGGSATLSVLAVGSTPLGYQWWKDGVALVDQTESSITWTNLGVADGGAYWAVVSNSYGTATSGVAWLTVNGATLDTSFSPGVDGTVMSLAAQPDGKVLLGGSFTTLGGQWRYYVGRLNLDGTPDKLFNPGADGAVTSLAVQGDGKVLLGGDFTVLGGQTRNYLGRLNADGTVETGFSPAANASVFSLLVQADEKILVAGAFTALGGQPRDRIGRLNQDGSLDAGFHPEANGSVSSLAMQADGKILVGGDFTALCGQARDRIGRLNQDGTLDPDFNPGASGYVNFLAVQPDGRILVSGSFTNLGGQARSRIGRLNQDGTLDIGFNPGADGSVLSLALQADGKVLVSGGFTTLGGQARSRIGRLNPDGTLDMGFNPGVGGANPSVYSMALQKDGRLLVGGSFTVLGGRACNYVGRLNATAPSTQSLSYEGSNITWLRGGTSPEVWRAAVEWSSDGLLWTLLGEATRVPGGWQWTNAIVPTQATIRARGFVAGGYRNNSSSFVEDYWGPPLWLAQPADRTNDAGSAAVFDGLANGTLPLSYQWFKDGVAVTDDGQITGATAARLTLPHVVGADAGGYQLVASNAYGTRTSLVARLTVKDPAITVSPVSQNRNQGESATLSVTAEGTAPLSYQWWKGGVALTGQTESSFTLSNLGAGDAGSYWAVVSSPYGSATSSAALLTVSETFADPEFNPGAGGLVWSLSVQVDGKILVGGAFSTLSGQTRNRIGRLNLDGTLDASFNPGANGSVSSLSVQEDGKILVGGSFSVLSGQTRNRIGRLNPDGTLDLAFNPEGSGSVSVLAVQADGKILVAGTFSTLSGQARNCIGRLNPDGTLDAGFNPGASGSVNSLAVQADGKILVGGTFGTLGGQTRNYIGRLNPDGTLDSEFNPGAGGSVNSLAVQADGKILVGGTFGTLSGQACNCIGRLNLDGTLDPEFNPGAGGSVNSLVVQADGKILVGGQFSKLGGQTRNYIGRLNPDGTLDLGFNPGAGGSVHSLAMQEDGKILAGGEFVTLGGQARSRIGRLNATGPVTQSATHDGSTITWLRGGASPEVWRTVFDWSTDGLLWAPLGEGTRVSGGWQRTNIVVPKQAAIRARGFVTGGFHNGSGWFVQYYGGAPLWISQPVSRTNDLGSTATFGGSAYGTPPLGYQWFKGEVAVKDDARIAGATTAWLTLANVSGADNGGYYLVVTNAHGNRTSVVATLTVNEPLITVSPVGQSLQAGDSPTLSVTAVGSTPLLYQWWKNGVALIGRTGSSLTLTNLSVADAGTYWVVVSGPYGSATSGVALLAVNAATLDAGFNPEANGSVLALAVYADGKTLLGGDFTTLGGQFRNRIGRLNPDGTLDTAFNPAANGSVNSLALQTDGKILVGGDFTALGGQARNRIGRLNADGTLDAGFNPGADGSVSSLIVQADGKISVGGDFRTLGGQPRNRIGRLNADGTLDTGFNPGANGFVTSLALQTDGQILVGGEFTALGGQTCNRVGRLTPNGTLDTGFNPRVGGKVSSISLQADGKILVGGAFATIGGQTRNYVARLNADGTLDPGFNPGASGEVYSLAVQADGRILVGGNFTTLAGQARNYIGRLNADGTLDARFNPGASSSVSALALLADGKTLVGGSFTTLCGQTRNSIGRLNATATATRSLRYEGTTITWLRGGTGPEVWRTVFDWSSDGLLWTPLGEGIRTTGRWQRTNAIAPAQATIRARGFVAGGYRNTSSWFVESVLIPSIPPAAPMLSVESVTGESIWFRLTGGTNAQYLIQTATNLSSAEAEWQPVTTLTLTNGWSLFDWTNAGESHRFFRAK
jgi:uncharacterized delta-60 repeat protein